MIKYVKNSDITKVDSGIIVQGCNAQGVMGSGVAKQLRAMYPQVYLEYLSHLEDYKRLEVTPLGTVSVTRVSTKLTVYSGITQEFYGKDGSQYVSYAAIYSVIATALSDSVYYGLSIHIPHMIGAGLGGGNYDTIVKLIDTQSKFYDKDIQCHMRD